MAGTAGIRASSAAVMMAGIAAAQTPMRERAASMACSSVRPKPLPYDALLPLTELGTNRMASCRFHNRNHSTASPFRA